MNHNAIVFLIVFLVIVFIVVFVSAVIMNEKDPNKSRLTYEERKEIAYNMGAKVRKILLFSVVGIPILLLISIFKAVKMQK